VFQRLLKKIASSLNKNKIPYMVIGGQAVLLYGEPRLTKDIDITLGIGLEGLEKVQQVVSTLNLKPLVSNVKDFVKETMVLPVSDEPSGIRVDFIFSFSAYEKQAIARAVGVRLGDQEVKFASLEDVVIHKVIAGRARDMEDIQSILLKNPSFDAPYVEKCLAEFDAAMSEEYLVIFRDLLKKLEKT